MGPLCIFCRIINNFYIKIGIFLVKNASKIVFFYQKWTFFSQKFSGSRSRSRKIFGRDPDLDPDPEISSIPKMVFEIGRDPGPDPDPDRDPGFRSRNRDPVRALGGIYVFMPFWVVLVWIFLGFRIFAPLNTCDISTNFCRSVHDFCRSVHELLSRCPRFWWYFCRPVHELLERCPRHIPRCPRI